MPSADLYIVTAQQNTKIGVTEQKIEKRISAYTTHNPDANLFATFRLESIEAAREIETKVKREFSKAKVGNGQEWFAVSAEIMADFVRAVIGQRSPGHRFRSPILHRSRLPENFFELLDQRSACLRQEPRNPDKANEIAQKCLEAFGDFFSLGIPHSAIDKEKLIRKDYPVVDLTAASQPTSSLSPVACVSIKKSRLKFPSEDHARYFWQLHKLSSGHSVAFAHTIVTMPYTDHWSADEKKTYESKTREFCSSVGWIFSDLSDWSWHYPGRTALYAFQMKSSPDSLKFQFQRSFRRFVIERENEILGLETNDPLFQQVVDDVIEDASFPLDVQSYSELVDRYLNPVWGFENSPIDGGYYGREHMTRLFEFWRSNT